MSIQYLSFGGRGKKNAMPKNAAAAILPVLNMTPDADIIGKASYGWSEGETDATDVLKAAQRAAKVCGMQASSALIHAWIADKPKDTKVFGIYSAKDATKTVLIARMAASDGLYYVDSIASMDSDGTPVWKRVTRSSITAQILERIDASHAVRFASLEAIRLDDEKRNANVNSDNNLNESPTESATVAVE